MTTLQNSLDARSQEIEEFALCATGGDMEMALEFVCKAIDGLLPDVLADKYVEKFPVIEEALSAASFKAAVKESAKEDML